MQSPQITVLYHANCSDGFGAAYAAWKKFGDAATYHAAHYGEEPPDVAGKVVFILDFSYSRDTLKAMIEAASSLTVLDHHKTAQADLEGLPGVYFDMTKSGAVMAWEFFHPDKQVPEFLRYIQDRDLWNWKLPLSKEFSVVFSTVPKVFEDYDTFLSHDKLDEAFEHGAVLLRSENAYISRLCKNSAPTCFLGHSVSIVNSPMFISELGSQLATAADFAMVWYHDHSENVIRVSLRSTDRGADVSEIAKLFGGGGHRNAAGFSYTGTLQQLLTTPSSLLGKL